MCEPLACTHTHIHTCCPLCVCGWSLSLGTASTSYRNTQQHTSCPCCSVISPLNPQSSDVAWLTFNTLGEIRISLWQLALISLPVFYIALLKCNSGKTNQDIVFWGLEKKTCKTYNWIQRSIKFFFSLMQNHKRGKESSGTDMFVYFTEVPPKVSPCLFDTFRVYTDCGNQPKNINTSDRT